MELIVASLLLIALIVSFCVAWLCGVYLLLQWWRLPRRFSCCHQRKWLCLWRWGLVGFVQGAVLLCAYDNTPEPASDSLAWLAIVGLLLVFSPYLWIHAANVQRQEREGSRSS